MPAGGRADKRMRIARGHSRNLQGTVTLFMQTAAQISGFRDAAHRNIKGLAAQCLPAWTLPYRPATTSKGLPMKTTAQQHNIPLPLTLMSRPRRSRARELAVVAGVAALLLAATFHAQEPVAAGTVAAPVLTR